MFKNLFKKKNPKSERPVLICIHGFGKRKTVEYANLVSALEDEYDMVLPELFDQRYKDDIVWHNWVSRAEEKIIEAKNNHRQIILIGFSMGGVIATYLASKFQIERLVLISPAFDYKNIATLLTSLKSLDKNKKPIPDEDQYVELPGEFTKTFMQVVDNCHDAIKGLHCPVLFMAAMGDELIPYTVSLEYYKLVPHENKNCIIFADGCHRILDDPHINKMAITMIKDFIEKKF